MLYQLSYTRASGGGRIRTCVGQSPADLQSAAISHSATPPDLLPATPLALPGSPYQARGTGQYAEARHAGLMHAEALYRADEGNRTPNLLITNQLLCQLSYVSQ